MTASNHPDFETVIVTETGCTMTYLTPARKPIYNQNRSPSCQTMHGSSWYSIQSYSIHYVWSLLT